MSRVHHDAARRSRRTVATAAIQAALVAVAAAGCRPGGGPAPTPPPSAVPSTGSAPTSPAPPGEGVAVGDVVVRGLPAGLRPAGDPAAALASAPALAVLPADGTRTVLVGGPTPADSVTRVVVAVDVERPLGVPGDGVDPPWARKLAGARALASDHPGSGTAYLVATTPGGRRWFIAVSGSSSAGRQAALAAIATASVPGT
jgi:hypothetical protein